MKFLIVFAVVCAVAMAAPVDDSKAAQILKYENDNIGVDGYNFSYETSDGVAREESGTLQNAGSENEGIAVKGSFSWIAGDGQQYSLSYVADENGFQPVGDHLPVAPVA